VRPRNARSSAGKRALSSGLQLRLVSGAAREDSRVDRPRRAPLMRASFFFQLGCPASYLAAERIERAFGQVTWVPTARLPVLHGEGAVPTAELLALAAREAQALRLPLVVPERFGDDFIAAWRAAACATAHEDGGRYVLAASRLAFCGGYDLDARTVIAEAARAARLDAREILAATGDPRWDEQLFGTARELAQLGITSSPAIRVGTSWFEGLHAVSEAATFSALSALREAARTKSS
jgi:2-hydroxychromene-2-carboxylate isomerase